MGGTLIQHARQIASVHLELAAHAGRTVSIDDLLDRVWTGVIVTPDSVYQAVAALRRLLGDDPKRPRYIATVPRLGYRLVAPVEPWADAPRPTGRRAADRVFALGAVLSLAALALIVLGPFRAARPVTVGVLPFMDLTPGMDLLLSAASS